MKKEQHKTMDITEQWKQDDSDYIRKKVIEHNMKKLPDELKTPNEDISFILRDDSGEICGGITANTFWQHVHIEFLWVAKEYRGEGYGRLLLEKVEQFARTNECRFVYLDSFSFQAPEFYIKNGYEVFGCIEDHPEGSHQYFLIKRFDK